MDSFLGYVFFVSGLFFVIKGSDLFIDGAVFIARCYRVSEAVIGITIVSMGNIIGSNIFNIMWVVGMAALAGPLPVDEKLLHGHIPFMVMVSVALIVFMVKGGRMKRRHGASLLAIYLAFLGYSYL